MTPATAAGSATSTYAFLKDVGPGQPARASSSSFLTIPFMLFCAFQMTFAIITPALITGATADRLKFGAYAVFIVDLAGRSCTARSPTGCSPAAGSPSMGALDFAGGAVVHINAGAAALALVLAARRRARAIRDTPMPPHNLPMTMIGTGILWFGWAGFNAGSALAANGVAAVGDHEHVPRRVGRDARLARWSSGSRKARPRRSARRPARSPGWWRSRRVPASSAAWPPVYIGAHRRRRLLPGARHQEGRSSSTTASTSSPSTSSAGSSGRSCSASSPTASINPAVTNEGLFLGGGTELLKDQVVASVGDARVLVRRHA